MKGDGKKERWTCGAPKVELASHHDAASCESSRVALSLTLRHHEPHTTRLL